MGYWLEGWSSRALFAVDNSLLLGDVIGDLPVLVVLDSRFPFSEAQSDGADLRFVSANHKEILPHEFELYDPSGQRALIWVRLTNLPKKRPTYFFLYWGNPSAPSGENPQELWREFEGVWHFNNDLGLWMDSTGNTPSITVNGSPSYDSSRGLIYGSASFTRSNEDHVAIPYRDGLALNVFTVETLSLERTTGRRQGILGTRNGGEYTFDLKYYDIYGKKIENNIGTGSNWITNLIYEVSFQTETWYHICSVCAPDLQRLYFNGELGASASYSAAPLFMKSGEELRFGDAWGPGTDINDEHFDGNIDEIRIHKHIRSRAYLDASFKAMKNELLRYFIPEDSDEFQENMLIRANF